MCCIDETSAIDLGKHSLNLARVKLPGIESVALFPTSSWACVLYLQVEGVFNSKPFGFRRGVSMSTLSRAAKGGDEGYKKLVKYHLKSHFEENP